MVSLGKMFGVRASSVLKWIRRFATEHAAKPDPDGKAIVLEVDEMWHFLRKLTPLTPRRAPHSGPLTLRSMAPSLTQSRGRRDPSSRPPL
jgi:hypothetical protein